MVCHYDAANRQSVIEVIDNGGGIPRAMKGHMFELFHSTKGNRGTGLGLAVAKKVVEEHEGTISATSVKGEGTTFRVVLPAKRTRVPGSMETHGPAR